MADIPMNGNGKKKIGIGLFHVLKDIGIIAGLFALVMIFAEIKIDVGVLKHQFESMRETMAEILNLHPRTTGGGE
jgi:hypothetical protein